MELSGRAEVLDILLEMMPRWSRLLLAGPAGQPVTIDFYKNVHRKGAVIAAMDVEAGSIFDLVEGPPSEPRSRPRPKPAECADGAHLSLASRSARRPTPPDDFFTAVAVLSRLPSAGPVRYSLLRDVPIAYPVPLIGTEVLSGRCGSHRRVLCPQLPD